MARLFLPFIVALAGSALAACAAISGLDQIETDACAPNGCSDATPPAADAFLDAALVPADGASLEPEDAQSILTVVEAGTDAAAQDDAVAAQPDAPFDAPPDAAGIDSAPPPDAALESGLLDAGSGTDASDAACANVYFTDSFGDNARGWTLDSSWSIAKECAAPPAPQKGNPDPTTDHTGATGSGVIGAFVCGNNATVTTPYYYATSPIIDTSRASGALKLDFWRWLNTDASDWIASTVDVYDGAKWVNVYTNPSGAGNLVTDAVWTHEAIDVSAQKGSGFRVRFGYSIASTGAYAMSSWNVDDVSVSSASCD